VLLDGVSTRLDKAAAALDGKGKGRGKDKKSGGG
jgi:hypothetical protein